MVSATDVGGNALLGNCQFTAPELHSISASTALEVSSISMRNAPDHISIGCKKDCAEVELPASQRTPQQQQSGIVQSSGSASVADGSVVDMNGLRDVLT